MSKQTENYIGSQQHWEDRINDDYDYLKQMEKEKGVEKLIYNGLEKRNKMSKQTAVEWLVEKIIENELIDVKNGHQFIHLQSIAKEMEKEQHKMTFNEALDEYSNRYFEQYYNETFKNETK